MVPEQQTGQQAKSSTTMAMRGAGRDRRDERGGHPSRLQSVRTTSIGISCTSYYGTSQLCWPVQESIPLGRFAGTRATSPAGGMPCTRVAGTRHVRYR